ncbi:MAG: signal transduction histidine kinase [Candidatus Krumholzibacteriia bacterium]
MVLNLVQNARQALGDSGVITVTSEMRADKVVIIVSDDGPGLPSGCSQKLFKPGFTTKTAANGTGLGLYISGNIVRRHNGEINASNRPEGGAEFVITLPSTA